MSFRVAGVSTVTPTTVRAGVSLFGVASHTGFLKQVHLWNTTATAVHLAVVRFTNATGVGSGLTRFLDLSTGAASSLTPFAGHTADGAIATGPAAYAILGAAIGAGAILTFDGQGLEIPAGTANGIGIVCPSGTGQIFGYTLVWDE